MVRVERKTTTAVIATLLCFSSVENDYDVTQNGDKVSLSLLLFPFDSFSPFYSSMLQCRVSGRTTPRLLENVRKFRLSLFAVQTRHALYFLSVPKWITKAVERV